MTLMESGDKWLTRMDGRQQTAAERKQFNQLQMAAKRPMTDEEFDRHMNSLNTTGIPND